ncbi:SDR family oxidoreductase [Streptomyces evansiae]|uniref:SDR family oxidoreductase n=1 Tax=Streptomyces evansiae TaxID=3075535 RepID=UPI0028874CC4|nr:SDR family oxidoreductase [Streptomyces sp. DSM 41859]MDT0421115.1 SDR family oxidoreductase [Streptomyces sp. DSM 41859]
MHVALTGATGFLGLRLLRRLLTTHPSLTVLTHAGSGDALSRITRFFALSGAPEELIRALPGRLRVVETSLEEPRLGLSRSAFRELADSLGTIWHSAGSINLEGDLAHLRRTNVEGTRHVLDLAATGRHAPLVHHVSTAFVAGARREGVAYEDELSGSHGFENAYERSKFEAERLVRDWSRTHGRPVLVLRPSILVTDLPPDPELPTHPLQVIEQILRDSLRTTGHQDLPGADRARMRMVGHPYGHLNLMPVEEAADVMVRLSEHHAARGPAPGVSTRGATNTGTTTPEATTPEATTPEATNPGPTAPGFTGPGFTTPGGVTTYHVVHHHDVPVPAIVALLERLVPLDLDVVPERPGDATPLEALMDFYPGFTSYLRHRRRFDDTRVRTLFGARPSGYRVDLDYLCAGLLRGWPVRG